MKMFLSASQGVISAVLLFILIQSCGPQSGRISVIFDTDTNNELDDQHALTYLLLNGDVFNVEGVTVNSTKSGGNSDLQYEEAKRVMQLSGLYGKIPLFKGANKSFDSIKNNMYSDRFDGSDAVNFIIERANQSRSDILVVIAVGKLTNIALAVRKDPAVAGKIRLVWLGSNYPEPGEYNQNNDTAAMNYLLNSDVLFEMVTVRSERLSGTAAVSTTLQEIREKMPGKGPHIPDGIAGRHGGVFTNFGDYSVSLFENIKSYGKNYSRPLYDMAAVAVVKNPGWARPVVIPAPLLVSNKWTDRPDNQRKIKVWEYFDRDAIINDFFNTMEHYTLAGTK